MVEHSESVRFEHLECSKVTISDTWYIRIYSDEQVWEFTMFKEMILMNRYGDMMSRPGSMMMGGGIGGFMPMSRWTPFLWQSFLIFIENFIDHHFQNQHQSCHFGDFRPTSRTGSRPSSGAGGRGPGEGASGVEDDAYGDKNMMMKQTHMNDRHTRTVDIHKR